MGRRLNRLIGFIPIRQVPYWQDRHTQKSIIVLKLVWVLFVSASIYLMVSQICDSTSTYLEENNVASFTLSKVPNDEPIWICFFYVFDISNSTHRYYVNLLSITDLILAHGITVGLSKKFTSEDQVNISSANEYITELHASKFYPLSKSNKIKDIKSFCFESTITNEIFCYQCIRIIAEFHDGHIQVGCYKHAMQYVREIFLVPVPLPHNYILSNFPELIIVQNRGVNYATDKVQTYRVRINRINYEVARNEKQCKPTSSGDIFHSNCYFKCTRHQFGRENGCAPFMPSEIYDKNLTSDLHLCTMGDIGSALNSTEFYRRNKATCLSECQELEDCKNPYWDFSGTTTFRESKMNTSRKDVTWVDYAERQVNFWFDFSTQQNVKQSLAKSWDDYLADLGGIIGLYFGFSIIGLVHLIFYCIFLYLRSRGRRKYSSVAQKLTQQQKKLSVLAKLRTEGTRYGYGNKTDVCGSNVAVRKTEPVDCTTQEATWLISGILDQYSLVPKKINQLTRTESCV